MWHAALAEEEVEQFSLITADWLQDRIWFQLE
jgi:hypothetical protein